MRIIKEDLQRLSDDIVTIKRLKRR